jgi:hypothetical protein
MSNQNAVELLAVKRKELADAELALARAESAFDTDTDLEIKAQERVTVLRRRVAKLEVESGAVLESQGAERAAAWLADYAKRARAAVKAINSKQAEVQKCIEAAVIAIQAEASARREVQRGALAADVLSKRFDLPKPNGTDLPAIVAWALPIINATDEMRPTPTAKRGVVVPRGASDSPEQLRRSTLRAVSEFAARARRELPADALQILDHAPVPADVMHDRVKPMPAHEERAAREMAEAKRLGELASAAVGAGTGLRTI